MIIELKLRTIGTSSTQYQQLFTWTVISNALNNVKTRKNLEASYISLWEPDINHSHKK